MDIQNNDMNFDRIIDRREKKELDKSGNIQMHNGKIVRNFENMISYAVQTECDDEFYQKLEKAVSKNELSSSPLVSSIIFEVFSIFFIFICFRFGYSINQILVFLLLPGFIFCRFTYSIIKECIKLYRMKKCVKEKENIYSVSLKIEGTRLYTDDSGDTSKKYYYIYSEPMLICVPKKIFDFAGLDKSLIGAVVGTGKHKMFYALYVI